MCTIIFNRTWHISLLIQRIISYSAEFGKVKKLSLLSLQFTFYWSIYIWGNWAIQHSCFLFSWSNKAQKFTFIYLAHFQIFSSIQQNQKVSIWQYELLNLNNLSDYNYSTLQTAFNHMRKAKVWLNGKSSIITLLMRKLPYTIALLSYHAAFLHISPDQ